MYEEYYDDIKKLHSEGLNDKEIGEVLSICDKYVGKIRRFHLGLKSQRDIRREWLNKEITRLHSEGLNDSQIANELGISHSAAQWNRKNHLRLETIHKENVYETDEDRIKGYMIRNIKGSAKRRGIKFDLHFSDLELPTHCPLLEIELSYRDTDGFNKNNRATIDRIDNSKGYVKGNVWVLSRLANSMKNEATPEQLETFCNNVLKKMI